MKHASKLLSILMGLGLIGFGASVALGGAGTIKDAIGDGKKDDKETQQGGNVTEI